MRSYKEQVAIITGAASGLGFAIASKLSQEGVKLALLDFNGDRLHQIETQMATETKSYILDITDEKQVQQTIEEIGNHFRRLTSWSIAQESRERQILRAMKPSPRMYGVFLMLIFSVPTTPPNTACLLCSPKIMGGSSISPP